MGKNWDLSSTSRNVSGAHGVAAAVFSDQGVIPAPVHPTGSPDGICVGAQAVDSLDPRRGESQREGGALTYEI